MAIYRVVHVTRRHGPGWTVEILVPGEKPRTRGFYETEAAAQVAADRLSAVEGGGAAKDHEAELEDTERRK